MDKDYNRAQVESRVSRICTKPEINDILEDEQGGRWIIATNITKMVAEMEIADGAMFVYDD